MDMSVGGSCWSCVLVQIADVCCLLLGFSAAVLSLTPDPGKRQGLSLSWIRFCGHLPCLNLFCNACRAHSCR
ncbi:hypothetical protein C8Q70DRAFT_948913 [Cubamyces menziesii]|nr:hypothetical protein C8Q70DRAFT_948913 [Cubamyces menziesii]